MSRLVRFSEPVSSVQLRLTNVERNRFHQEYVGRLEIPDDAISKPKQVVYSSSSAGIEKSERTQNSRAVEGEFPLGSLSLLRG